jgi:hypothetical protein
MNKSTKAVNDYNEVDIFGSQDHFDMVCDALFDYGDTHESMHRAYLNALALVRKGVIQAYGETTYVKYEDDIKHELFFMLVEFVEDCAYEASIHRFDYEFSIREFLERELEPFEALDCLYANYVEVFKRPDLESLNVH